MILPILTYPAPSLKKKSLPVAKINDQIRTLAANMFETMRVSAGIGLAAAQVGENIRLIVMDVPDEEAANDEQRIPRPLCFVNPHIIKREGEVENEEGCLSCPELTVTVKRAEAVVVESLGLDGKMQTHALEGLEAICLQHEMDHLEGKLLTDYLSRLKRELYRRQAIKEKE